MKVLYDHQTFTWQNYGGISRYFAELISYFNAAGKADCTLSLVCSNNYYLLHNNIFVPSYPARMMGAKLNRRKQYSINKVHSRISLIKGSYDIFHPTYYDTYFLRHIRNKPYVLTVYDMIHEIYPELAGRTGIAEHKKKASYQATKIISISENTKKDILRFYDIDKEKIDVIHLGSSINMGDEIKSSYRTEKNDNMALKLPERFILFVGNRSSYKNFIMLVDSILPTLRDDDSLFLVCAGGGDFSASEIAYFDKLAIRHKIIHETINDFILAQLYQKALVFVFPSLYEGFGLPILESFSCGCPVALSDASSFPEVAKDAAIYFDPLNKSSIEEAISKIIYDEALGDNLRHRGYKVLKEFSWEKTAEKTLQVYESIL